MTKIGFTLKKIGYVSGDYLKCAFVDYMKILYDTYIMYSEYNECYFFDINKDGTTELIVQNGTCEANYQYDIYTAKNNSAVYVDTISAGHSGLFESDNGDLIIQYAQMGYEAVSSISMENGKITITELYSKSTVVDYSNPGTPLEYATLGELFG